MRVPVAVFNECAVAGKPKADTLRDYLQGKTIPVDLCETIITPAGLRNRNDPANRNNNLGFRLALAQHAVGMGVQDQIVILPCGSP